MNIKIVDYENKIVDFEIDFYKIWKSSYKNNY